VNPIPRGKYEPSYVSERLRKPYDTPWVRPIVRSTVQALTDDELMTESVQEQIKALDLKIHDTIALDGNLVTDLPSELLD
jgi:hypothetical protein